MISEAREKNSSLQKRKLVESCCDVILNFPLFFITNEISLF